MLANQLLKHKKMEKRVIINDYHSLVKIPINKAFQENIPPREMIDLLKEYLPIHIGVATVWNKNKVEQFAETNKLHNACKEFRKKIKEFDFFGSIIFVLNGSSVVVRIYFDEEEEQKEIEVTFSNIVDYECEFQ